jgi:hypothetical protein
MEAPVLNKQADYAGAALAKAVKAAARSAN